MVFPVKNSFVAYFGDPRYRIKTFLKINKHLLKPQAVHSTLSGKIKRNYPS